MVLGQGPRRRKFGFTYFDLLVVIAIVAILIGLLATWFLKSRRAADQVKSLDNLQKLADAAIRCNNDYKKLPPGVGTYPRTTGPAGTLFYWLLPWLGEDAKVFIVPGDPSLPPNNILKNGLEACSYAGNGYVFAGDYYPPNGRFARDPPPTCSCIFNTCPTANRFLFPDGAENTILFMEKYATCSLVKKPRAGYEENGPGEHGWADATLLAKKIGTNGYYSNFTPIQLSLASPQFLPDPLDADCKLPQGFSSKSIAVAMADGSTRLVSFRVSPKTWALLLLPNDGQQVPEDWR